MKLSVNIYIIFGFSMGKGYQISNQPLRTNENLHQKKGEK
jgi:hypothetical protein